MLLKRLRQLAGDSMIYGLSSIIARFVSIWLTPIYTRLLTPDDYGTMSLVAVTLALIQSFSALALDQAAGRWFVDATDEAGRRRPFATWAWTNFATASCAAAVLGFGSEMVSQRISGGVTLAPWLRLVALTLPLSVASSVGMTWLRMQRRAWATVGFVTGTTLFQITLTFILVAGFKQGLFGLYMAQVVSGAVALVVALRMAGGAMLPRYFDAALLRVMLRYSTPLIPAAIAVWVVGSVDRFFVQRYVSTAAVGVFSIGVSIASFMTMAVWAFQQAWSPFALSIHQESDAHTTYATAFLGYCVGGAFAVAGLSLFAPIAIRIFATPSYDRASEVVGTMAMSYVLMGLGSVVTIGYSIARASRPTAIAVGVAAAVTIALNALLVPRYGMVGSAIATLVGQGTQPAILLARSRHVYYIEYPVGRGAAVLAWAMVLVVLGETVLPSSLSVSGIALRTLALLTVPAFALAIGVVRPAQLRSLRVAFASR